METVTFKLHEKVLKKIDEILEPLHFSNRTEFIREAVREKLHQIETEKFMNRLAQHRGTAKVKISNEQLRKIREDVAQEYAAKFGLSLK